MMKGSENFASPTLAGSGLVSAADALYPPHLDAPDPVDIRRDRLAHRQQRGDRRQRVPAGAEQLVVGVRDLVLAGGRRCGPAHHRLVIPGRAGGEEPVRAFERQGRTRHSVLRQKRRGEACDRRRGGVRMPHRRPFRKKREQAPGPRRGDAERVGGPVRIQPQQHAGRRAGAERTGGAGGVESPRAHAGIRGPADARRDLVPRRGCQQKLSAGAAEAPGQDHRDRERDRREVQTRREAVGVVEILHRGHERVVPGRTGDAAALRPREKHRASIAEEGQRSRARRRHVGPRPGEARGKEVQEAEPGVVRHEVRDSGVGDVANRTGQMRGEGQGFGVRHVLGPWLNLSVHSDNGANAFMRQSGRCAVAFVDALSSTFPCGTIRAATSDISPPCHLPSSSPIASQSSPVAGASSGLPRRSVSPSAAPTSASPISTMTTA